MPRKVGRVTILQLLDNYRGKLTGEKLLPPGVYTLDDPIAGHILDELATKPDAVVLQRESATPPPAPVEPEPLPDGYADDDEEGEDEPEDEEGESEQPPAPVVPAATPEAVNPPAPVQTKSTVAPKKQQPYKGKPAPKPAARK